MLLAIDPGTDTGWSLFDRDTARLMACGLGDPRDFAQPEYRTATATTRVTDGGRHAFPAHPAFGAVTRLVVEKPRINPGGKARPNDMITLAVKTGRWTGIFEDVTDQLIVEPWEWKGGLSKEEGVERVWARLGADERRIVDDAVAAGGKRGRPMAASKVHNMMDAVGIGLHGVGRGLR